MDQHDNSAPDRAQEKPTASDAATLPPNPTTVHQPMRVPLKKTAIRYFGDYVLLGEIARGGMGVVYHALQTNLDREVAIKMIDAGKLAGESAIRRFRTEAEAMAQLEHPNIVSIYEVGEHDGQHYISMRLVDGANLAEHIGNQPMEPHRAAEIVATVARAVQYAHDRGVLHRDLKPSNILLDNKGQPHVTDFGIAKLAERGEGLTGSDALLGTPEFMAPEQAAGNTRQVTTAADTYSLGAVLYHLLTGQPPLRADTPLETLNRVVHQEPVSPRFLNPCVDRDLETICVKCLAKDPQQRYRTARELAEELDCVLTGKPIRARPVGQAVRLWRWSKRHPTVASLSAGLATAVVLGGLLVTTSWRREKAQFEQSQAELSDRLQISEVQQANQLMAVGDSSEALAVLANTLRRSNTNYLAADRLMAILTQRSFPVMVGRPLSLTGRVTRVQYALDGQHICLVTRDGMASIWDSRLTNAVAGPFQLAASDASMRFSQDGKWVVALIGPGYARVFDAVSGQPVAPPLVNSQNSTQTVFCTAFTEDGRWLATGYDDGIVRIWDVQTGKELAGSWTTPSPDPLGPVRNVRFSLNGGRLVALFHTNVAVAAIWDVTSSPKATRYVRHEMFINHAEFSPNGRWLLTASADKRAFVWDTETGERPKDDLQHDSAVNHAAFSPDGDQIVTVSDDGTARRWRENKGQSIGQPLKHGASVRNAGYSARGDRFFTISSDLTTRVWDSNSGKLLAQPLRHVKRIVDAEFRPDGGQLVALTGDGTVTLWDLPVEYSGLNWFAFGDGFKVQFTQDGKQCLMTASAQAWAMDVSQLKILGGQLAVNGKWRAQAFSPDGQTLATAIEDGRILLCDARSGQRRMVRQMERDDFVTIEFSPDSQRLLTVYARHWSLLEAASGRPLLSSPEQNARSFFARFSKTGRWLVTLRDDGKAIVWDTESGRLRSELPGSQDLREHLKYAEFSPDDQRLVTTCEEGTARVWNVDTGRLLASKLHHESEITHATFSPDGRLVATSSTDGKTRIWEVVSDRHIYSPFQHEKAVKQAVFSSDGRRIATASEDKTARVWDVTTGLAVSEPVLHSAGVELVAFSPSGQELVTVDSEGAVKIALTPRCHVPTPPWLPQMAEAVASRRLDAGRALEAVPAEALAAVRMKVMGGEPTDSYSQWAQWFFSDTLSRPLFPGSSIPVKADVENLYRNLYAGFGMEEELSILFLPFPHSTAYEFAQKAREVISGESTNQPGWEALADLLSRRAVALAPDRADAWVVRCEVLKRIGRGASESATVEQGLGKLPESAESYLCRGLLLECTNRLTEAFASYTEALALATRKGGAGQRLCRAARQRRADVLSLQGKAAEAKAERRALTIPERPPEAPRHFIDLSATYTHGLTESFQEQIDDFSFTLASLPAAIHKFNGVSFDVRGVIQLSGKQMPTNTPSRVDGIAVKLKAVRLHFLHSADTSRTMGTPVTFGTQVAAYVVRYADGKSIEIPVRYGQDLIDWRFWPSMREIKFTGTIAWQGPMASFFSLPGHGARLFQTAWTNPRPDVEITTLDFVSTSADPAPLLIAVTAANESQASARQAANHVPDP